MLSFFFPFCDVRQNRIFFFVLLNRVQLCIFRKTRFVAACLPLIPLSPLSHLWPNCVKVRSRNWIFLMHILWSNRHVNPTFISLLKKEVVASVQLFCCKLSNLDGEGERPNHGKLSLSSFVNRRSYHLLNPLWNYSWNKCILLVHRDRR